MNEDPLIPPNTMTPAHLSIPLYNTLYPIVLNKYKNRVFVETGLWRGQGIQVALDCGFEKIYSCDIDPIWINYGVRRYSKTPNVNIFYGNSVTFLNEVFKKETQNITFWLDAHIPKCPLLDELEVIKNSSVKNATILIDDLNLYEATNKETWANETPISVKQIMYKIIEINPNYKFFIEQRVRDNGVDNLSIYGTVVGGQILAAYL